MEARKVNDLHVFPNSSRSRDSHDDDRHDRDRDDRYDRHRGVCQYGLCIPSV